MPEFKLSRFRYTWRGTWVTSTAYNKDDVVRYGGQSWVCIRQHTSDAFNTDQQFLANESATEFSPAWARMTLGYEYQGEWSADTVYAPGDIVRQGGNLYVADQGHTASTNFSTDYEVEITVTVARDSESTGNVYILDGVEQPTLNLVVGYTYVFNQNDDTNVYFPNVSINNQHPINFSADNQNGELGGGTVFLDDVIYRLDGETVTKAQYWSGFEDATTREVRLTVTDSTPTTLYYWCQNHLNMGASASVGTDGLVNKWKNFASGIDWDPNWATNTRYGVNDVVRYGGYVYRCVEEHTSSSSTASGLEVDQDKWAVLYEGIEYRGQWTTNTRYRINDLVEHNGFLWRCKQAHTPGSDSTINFDSSAFWEAEIPGYEFDQEFQYSREYTIGDVVRHGGNLYECISENYNSSPGNPTDTGATITYTVTISTDPSGEEAGNKYFLNGEYKPQLRFTVGNTYVFNQDDDTNVYFPNPIGGENNQHPLNFSADNLNGPLDGGTSYLENVVYILDGNVVNQAAYWAGFEDATQRSVQITITDDTPTLLYYWCQNHLNMGNSIAIIEPGSEGWQLLAKGKNFRGQWAQTNDYKPGDVVRRGGNLYIALRDIADDGSSLDYLADGFWELVNPSQNWIGYWTAEASYEVGDVVLFNGDSYRCNFPHTASISPIPNFPGDNGEGIDYWDLLIESPADVGMSSRGDLLTFDLSRDEVGDGSSFGFTDIEIGANGQVLSVDNDGSANYTSWGEVARTFYVSTLGLDDNTDSLRGISPFKPFKTVRYAAEHADDGFEGTTTIHVDTGVFEEVLPIIIPKKTAIVGSELRSTNIQPNSSMTGLSSSTQLKIILSRLEILLDDVITGSRPSNPKTSGNPVDPVVPTRTTVEETVVSGGPSIFTETTVSVVGTVASSETVKSLLDDFENYIEFYLEDGSNNPDVTSTNTISTDQTVLDSATILTANANFFAEEAAAYAQVTFPDANIDTTLLKADVKRYINAFAYDLQYPGNYKTILEARYFRNETQGSQGDDMFYCRDATGVRNCTLEGLTGTLNPPGVFDLYQRPTGGAFVSLDPGWGPEDDRTWITTRSPYIQGVTTVGTACYGQKVDGAIHNGGNRSIVSNDFTQVLSDGIGAYVLNNARAELVSVFSYYAQVGYLAERGGVIRATNGNSSYGNFGAIADGVDPTETPLPATVNTRNNEASVVSTFAGEIDDFYAFEYSNAGQNYTTATPNIVGSGINVDAIYEEFRDNAVFQVRLTDANDDRNIDAIGGTSYTISRANAQVNTTIADQTSIKISNSDTNEEAEVLGKRIIIVSGAGAGQYGIVDALDANTKVLDVVRETDGQPGWDHIIPGTDLVRFQSNTAYVIEPRPVFSEPAFSTNDYGLDSSQNYVDSVYGETTLTFTAVTGDLGTGDVTDTGDVTPAAATFDVVKRGRTYEVSLNDAGAGYAVGDTIVIEGTQLSALSPYNDVTIEVTAITDDSTNGISNFTANGTGASGRFVISAENNVGAYSDDGETWTQFNYPTSGPFALAAGESKFVAVKKNSNTALYSLDGENWTATTMPASAQWTSVTHGGGVFVAVAEDGNNAAYSLDGETWVADNIPDFGDSTVNNWVDITYGQGKFVAIANSNNVAAYGTYANGSGITWNVVIMDVIADSSQVDWTGVAYGDNRFIAVSSEGFVGYSFDAVTWKDADQLPSQDGSTAHVWTNVRYGNGVFVAIGQTGSRTVGNDATTGPSTFIATSEYGIEWTGRNITTEAIFETLTFGNPYVEAQDSSLGTNTPMWIAPGYGSDRVNKFKVGRKPFVRAGVSSGLIESVKILDPGSGYDIAPTFSLVDPNATSAAEAEIRVADGVLPQPSFANRGFGYRVRNNEVTVTGDGFADEIPTGQNVTISGLTRYPEVGAQITFAGLDTPFNIQIITELGDLGYPTEGLSAALRITPGIRAQDNLVHDTVISIRERVAQCRITGHDFLDVGTGNFEETNYPALYQDYIFTTAPENEVVEEEGGRVFYTSTDQSGNFRTGELFSVEQATGIVTISSDFFDLGGLSELRLGGIRVGGTGVVVREFSTDSTFSEDSNNIVPTQRAIATYLESRLSLGGSTIETNSFTAGSVIVGPDGFGNSSGLTNIVNSPIDFGNSGIDGYMLAQSYFYRSFNRDSN